MLYIGYEKPQYYVHSMVIVHSTVIVNGTVIDVTRMVE